MAETFEAQVSKWVAQTKERVETIVKESAQRVIAEAQKPVGQGGRMRVKTGFLRASGQASTTSMPTISANASHVAGQGYDYSDAAIALVIAGARMGQTLYFGYTANYAAAREFGARGQTPDAFVRSASQMWPQIVKQVSREALARSGRLATVRLVHGSHKRNLKHQECFACRLQSSAGVNAITIFCSKCVMGFDQPVVCIVIG